jgi:hypothetical protein
MRKTKDIKKCELEDIQHFLDLSRTVIRQLKLIKNSEIDEHSYEITRDAAKKVYKEIEKFITNDKVNGGN